ncbi:MAG: phytanoyl-CoA dioxygenase family protein [Myxococcales bacterium]|nr:phytanoyl-CoA dioxygenase family protein [Myxococcales bacterium]
MYHDRWSSAACRDFLHDGFVVIREQWSAAELVPLQKAFDQLEIQAQHLQRSATFNGSNFILRQIGTGPNSAIERVVWCGATEPALLQPALDPRVLQPALEILNGAWCDQLINQAHFKQPGDQVHFPLHQDAWNRRWGTALWRDRSLDGGYVQSVLTLDPMSSDNGPLLVVPGSHRAGPLVGQQRHTHLQAIVDQLGTHSVLAEPGSIIFFGPFLIHGSEPNQSPYPRRVLINGYARHLVNRRKYPGAGRGIRRQLF